MKKFFLFSFFLLFAILANAQTDLKQIVPPNPNVASLFKSVLTPVSEYSGLPNVSVPLYTVNEGGISIPMAISYSTGGIQVTEESGVVGLGWALNAGGAITRSINGLDDFKTTFGYYYNNKVHPNLPPERDPVTGAWNPDTHAFVDALNPPNSQQSDCKFPVGPNNTPTSYSLPPIAGSTSDTYDYMPDMFYFNFNGYSGSFVFDEAGEVVLLNKKGIKITPTGSGNINFEILTEDGTKYEFTKRISTSYISGNTDPYVSSWYLEKITDIYGNVAQLSYDTSETLKPFRSFTQSYYATVSNSTNLVTKYEGYPGPAAETGNALLTTIEIEKVGGLKTQEIRFNYSDVGERRDMDSRYLESVQVLNSQLQEINRYDFAYSYFGSLRSYDYRSISLENGDYGQVITALEPGYPDLNLRLRLDAVTENNISTHSFDYFDANTVPNKTYMGQDYWGFYNGEYNSDIFIPNIYSHVTQFSTFDQLKRANRLPSENFAKLFSLRTIVYPTKGATEFDYELNTYQDNGNFNDAPITTKPEKETAYRLSTPADDDDDDEVYIKPNRFGVLKLTYDVILTGWDAIQYPDSRPPAPDFQNDFYVEFTDVDGNLVAPSRVHIPQGNTQWESFSASQNENFEAIIEYSVTEEWRYDINTQYKLTDDEYIIKAHFDSHNGLYKGIVNLKAEWEAVQVSDEQAFSTGGGLRVASVTDYDSDGTVATKRNYNYHYMETANDGTVIEKSYGKIKTLPNYAIHQTEIRNISADNGGEIQGPSDQTSGFLPVVLGTATSHNAFSKDQGSYVGYDQVEVTMEGLAGDNGKTIKYFINQEDHFRSVTQPDYEDSYFRFPPVRVPHNGLLKKEEHYKRTGNTYVKVAENTNEYEINGFEDGQFNLFRLYENEDRVISASKELPISSYGENGQVYWYCDAMRFQMYPYYSNLIQQTGSSQTVWDTNGANPMTTLQSFEYNTNTHYQRTLSKLTNSKGEEVVTRTYYPDDVVIPSSLGVPNLSSEEFAIYNRLRRNFLHRIAEPVQTETTVNGEKTVQRTYYKDWDGDEAQFSYKVWPQFVKTLKGTYNATDNPLENRLNYLEYDAYGNPLMVSKENGAIITYLWGYDHKYPVAKIENATYQEAIATGVNLSLINNTSTSDAVVRSELKKVRDGLPNAMVTTFTYNPLQGVTSVTDPRDYTMFYTYDSYNRLKEVRDQDNHLVSDYEYEYKQFTND